MLRLLYVAICEMGENSEKNKQRIKKKQQGKFVRKIVERMNDDKKWLREGRDKKRERITKRKSTNEERI